MKRWPLVVLGLALVAGFVVALGNFQWRWTSDQMRQQITEAGRMTGRGTYDPRELVGLPAPVVRYFAATLRPGQPIIVSASLRHRGTMNLGNREPAWRSFRSEQLVVTQRPGFHWDARVQAMPGAAAFVRDAYVEGIGVLRAAIAGVVPVMAERGRGDLARGELMRFLAESAWVPTALLPSQGVRWAAVDDTTADATLTDGEVSVTLRFRFAREGDLVAVSSDGRPRGVEGRFVATPWSARYWNHARRGNMRIPLDAEVAWGAPGQERPYWRGHVEQADYQFER